MGKSIMPMIVSLVGVCGFRLVWLSTVFRIPAYHTIMTVYYSYPITWAMTAAAHFCCWIVAYRKLRSTYEATDPRSKLHI
jgi:Na+-driven multidrug efflux pump